MLAARIVMRPVNESALFVPFVFSVERDGIASTEGGDSRGEVNVVGNQQRLSGFKTQDEALVAAAVIVIGKYLHDDAFTCDLNATLLFPERTRNRVIGDCRWNLELLGPPGLVPAEIQRRDDGYRKKILLHLEIMPCICIAVYSAASAHDLAKLT